MQGVKHNIGLAYYSTDAGHADRSEAPDGGDAGERLQDVGLEQPRPAQRASAVQQAVWPHSGLSVGSVGHQATNLVSSTGCSACSDATTPMLGALSQIRQQNQDIQWLHSSWHTIE